MRRSRGDRLTTAGSGRPRQAPSGSTAPPPVRTVFTLSEEETFDVGRNLGSQLGGGELIVLEGDLGLGKTVFARGIAVGLGIPGADVSSPSYTLVHEYRGGRLPMFHVDLYRIEVHRELETLGLEELLSAGAVVVVEWGEKLAASHRRDALTIRFHDLGEGSRRIEVGVSRAGSSAPPW